MREMNGDTLQDIYAFDVGDFGKLGLLRHLVNQTSLNLGVLWWRTRLGSPGEDGRHTAYLQREAYGRCDRPLWDGMRVAFRSDDRRIVDLHPFLPPGTRFHDVEVPRPPSRREWFIDACQTVQGRDIVFCDPDNGIAFQRAARSERHVAADEVRDLFAKDHSLVLYHHLNRQGKHPQQLVRGLGWLRELLPTAAGVWGCRFARGSSRIFFVVSQPRHAALLSTTIDSFRHSAWTHERHFHVHDVLEQVPA